MNLTILFLVATELGAAAPASAVPPSPTPSPSASAVAARHTMLVLAPEASGATTETWVGEAVADQLPRSLALLGVPAISRPERLQAQAALEIPDVPLSRATSVRVAEVLGAARLVTGTYSVEGPRLTLSLRLLDVDRATLSAPLIASGPLEDTLGLIDHLAWDLALAGPTTPRRTKDELLAARPKVTFEAFKVYARALTLRDPRKAGALIRRVVTAAPAFD